MIHKNKNNSAFTIVELLIVIVIIGILAAITVVSYTGITKKANESTVQAELANAKKQISLYYADHGVYPKALGLNNCLSNDTVTPDPDTKYCLKSSGGSTYSLTDATGSDYTLTLTKGANIAYKVTKDTAPISTTDVAAASSFVKTWGGVNGDFGYDLVQTNDKGYAVTGYGDSYGAGSIDVFFAKYDSSGGLVWSKTWGGTGDEYGQGLIQTADGGFAITGYTNSFGAGNLDLFLIKYDSNGNLVWNKTWGGASYEYGNNIIQAEDGGYVVVGHSSSYGAGSNDVLIVKYDVGGNLVWSKLWGGSGIDIGYGVLKTNDNSYIVAGRTGSYGGGSDDVLILKYDSNGNLIWNKTWGGSGGDYGFNLIQSNDGNYVVAGYTASYGSGNNDSLLIKYDPSGNLIWNKAWGGANSDVGQGLVQNSDNSYITIGYTLSYGSGNYDVFLSKVDSSGNLIWNKTWGGAGYDTSQNIIQTVDGEYAITGYTENFGAGSRDMLFMKYNSNGNINNCISPMCQTPSATITTPSATITTPSATTSNPSATITTPTATVTTPSAIVTTVVAP